MLVRATRPLAVIVGVTLLVVVVALASRPSAGAVTPAAAAAATRTALDAALYLFISLSLIEGLILVWLLWPHEDVGLGPRLERRRHSLLTGLVLAITLVLVVWSRSGHLGRLPLFGPRSRLAAGLPGTPRLDVGGGGTALGTDWVAMAIAAVVLVVVGVVGWRLLRAPGRKLRVVRSPLAELESVLDDALLDATAQPDPRRAVLAAWARVERLLAEHDAGRRHFEAPFEFAARASVAVGLDAGALDQLASLYEWARFSLHEVTSAMRRDALEGLAQVRERLRLAHS